MITFENLQLVKEIITQTGGLLDCPYFKENYKLIPLGLRKQQVLNADPKSIQKINFTANPEPDGNIKMLFIIEETKETVLSF